MKVLRIVLLLFLPINVYAAPGLLTGQTPASYSLPTDWTLLKANDFESGCGTGGNCTLGQSSVGTGPGGVSHSGTQAVKGTYAKDGDQVCYVTYPGSYTEVYLSWYDYVDSTALFTDEYFIADFMKRNPDDSLHHELIIDYIWCAQNYPNNTGCKLDIQSGGEQGAYSLIGTYDINNIIRVLPVGQWVQFEVHFRPNTPGNSDGFVRVYMTPTSTGITQTWMNINDFMTNYSLDMNDLYAYIGGTVTRLEWSQKDPEVYGAAACNFPTECGTSSDGCRNYMGLPVLFSNPACGTSQPSFNRYIDDVIVMTYGGTPTLPPDPTPDIEPPYITDLDPVANSSGNQATVRTISVTVRDDGSTTSSVVRSTVTMGVSVNGGAWTTYSYGAGLTFVPDTATGTALTATRTMATDWNPGDVVSIRINATDNSGNVMTQQSYGFSIAAGVVPGTKSKAEVLSYLADLPNQSVKKVLSGQMIGYCGNESATMFDSINSKAGHYPALMTGNYAEFSGCVTGADIVTELNPYLKAHWLAGGLVAVDYHANNPATGTWENITAPDFADLLDTGTTQGGRWRDQMDRLAVGLQDLEDDNVVVLFRPFIEVTGNWFWYHTGSASEMKSLWVYTHNYLTTAKGLSNLLWVFGAAQQPWGHLSPDIYPGSAYVDIVGTSSYPETVQHGSMASWYQGWAITDVQWLISTGKPYAFTEMGLCNYYGCSSPQYLPTIISDIKTYVPEATYWSNWNSTWSLDYGSSVSALLSDSWVVNRDDNPSGTFSADNASLTITTTSLPAGTVGSSYSQSLTLVAIGAQSPYAWDNIAGTFPPGLVLSEEGVISGVPSATGTYSFTVEVVSSDAYSDNQTLSILINPLIPLGQYVSSAVITDTTVDITTPGTNYSTAALLHVYTWPEGVDANRILMTMDFSSVPDNVTVTAASLFIYNMDSYDVSGGTNPMRVHVYRTTVDNIAAATWTNYTASRVEIPESLTNVSLLPGWVEIPLTAIAIYAYANGKTVTIAMDGGTSGVTNTNRAFASMEAAVAIRPYVSVTYTKLTDPGGTSISAPGKMKVSKFKGTFR